MYVIRLQRRPVRTKESVEPFSFIRYEGSDKTLAKTNEYDAPHPNRYRDGAYASVPFISTQVVSAIRYPFAKRKLSDFHTGISEKHFQICRQTKSIIVDETKISKIS